LALQRPKQFLQANNIITIVDGRNQSESRG
jgi:hypothetical protein